MNQSLEIENVLFEKYWQIYDDVLFFQEMNMELMSSLKWEFFNPCLISGNYDKPLGKEITLNCCYRIYRI